MRFNYFWDFIESADYYDREYRYDMDRYHGDNTKPFASWFPEGQDRAYVPFQVNGDDTTIKATNILTVAQLRASMEQILNKHNFKLADFRKGLASPTNNEKRQQRIIPVLQTISKKDQALAAQVAQITKEYEAAQLRLNPGPNNFMIVISQDPHDIALMTYDRHWKMASCMRLKDDKDPGGAKWHQVYDEVREGGLIAYLTEPDDKDIKKPLARVLLRRFNNNKTNIALCEETVYGMEIPGFKEAVKDWINQHQPKAYGKFTRKGAEWSDTFGTQHAVYPKHNDLTKENQPQLLDMLDSLDNFEEFLKQASPMIGARKWLDHDFIAQVIERVNNRFAKKEEHSLDRNTRMIYTFYVPRVATDLGLPVEKIENIIKGFPLHDVTSQISTPHPDSPRITKYLMPVLTQMTNNIDAYNLDRLAGDISRNPELQSEEFINSIPTSAIEEMMHYVTNPNIRFLMIQKPVHQMKKHLPALVKRYQAGDQDALDTITDEWIQPIMDALPDNKTNWFLGILKELLPPELYNKLYGHTYR